MSKVVCNISNSGSMFMVNDALKDSLFSIGTTGVLTCVLGPDHNNPNIIYQEVLVTKRGKKGKKRIEAQTLLTPIYKIPRLSIEDIVPKSTERKGFVDVDVDSAEVTKPLDSLNNDDFIAWLYARLKFLNRLDQLIYPGNHPTELTHAISKSIGLNNNKYMSVWPKTGKLKNFFNEIELRYNSGDEGLIAEEYTSPAAKLVLLHELRRLENMLIIPRLEHQQRIYGILSDAIVFIEKLVTEKKDIEGKEDILLLLKETKAMSENKQLSIKDAVVKRLKMVVSARNMLGNDEF